MGKYFSYFKLRIIILAILFIVAGIALTCTGLSEISKLNGYVPDFNYDSITGIERGDFVQGYVENILDCYAYQTTTNTTMGIESSSSVSAEYFIMPVINEADIGKEMFITIKAGNKADREMLYKISDATWEYLGGKEDVSFPEMPIVARVRELPDDVLPYMTDWFRESEVYGTDAADINRHIMPYMLIIADPKDSYVELAAGLVMLAVSVVIAVIFIVKKRKEKLEEYETNVYGTTFPEDVKPFGANSGIFSENSVPPPMPDIPQPIQPDSFFDRPAKTPKEEKPAPKPETKPEKADPPAEKKGDMTGLDAEGLGDKLLSADDIPAKPVGSDMVVVETSGGEVKLPSADELPAKPVGSDMIGLEAKSAEAELPHADELPAKPVGSDMVEVEAETAKAHLPHADELPAKPVGGDMVEIDISSISTDDLAYYDKPADESDLNEFEFDNDTDFGLADADSLTLSD